MKRTITLLAALLLAAGLLAAVTSVAPAQANPWGSCYTDPTGTAGCPPDKGPHTYCFADGLNADLKANADQAMANLDATTLVPVEFDTVCDSWNLSNTNTDVIFKSGNLDGSQEAITSCRDYHPDTNRCDMNTVILDIAQINLGDSDEVNQTVDICHEVGHTLGLSHGTSPDNIQDCMTAGSYFTYPCGGPGGTGCTPPLETKWRRYGTHNTEHINNSAAATESGGSW